MIQISPLIPILCLFAGALLVQIGGLVRFRWATAGAVLATGLAAASLLPLLAELPATAVMLDWRPVTLFGSTAGLRMDGPAWLLSFALLMAGLGVTLAWLSVPEYGRPAPRALVLVMLAVGYASILAANLLTLVLCWGVLDGLFALAVLLRGAPASGRRAQLALGMNGLATLSVWIVAVLIEGDHLSPYWHLMILPSTAQALMAVAAALRLGLYPLNLWQPIEWEGEPDQAILIYLIPALAGLSMWVRLDAIQALPEGGPWQALAILTALVAGAEAWMQADPRASFPYLALGYGGMLLLGVTFGLAAPMVLAAGSAAWLLGLVVLFIGQPWMPGRRLWAALTAIGAAILAGIPGTLGFLHRATLYAGGGGDVGDWLLLALAVVAEALLLASVVRRVLIPDVTPVPGSRLASVGYGASLVAVAAPAIFLSLVPLPSPLAAPALGLAAWVVWALPLAGGVALAVWAEPWRGRLCRWETLASRVLRLDWLYSLLLNVLRLPARLGLWLTDVLEGDGAFLWMLLILALVILYLRGVTIK